MATLGSVRPFIASHIFERLACIGGSKHDEQCHTLLMTVSMRSLSFLGPSWTTLGAFQALPLTGQARAW